MLFNTFSSNECIRLGYMPLDHPNLTAHQVSCDKTYHDFANLSLRLHAPLLLLVANLCIVFLFQLGGWSLDQCAKRRGVREAILTLLTGAVFLLPLVPVTVLSANGAMRIFTSLVIPMCFAAVLPLLCGLLVWWLDHKCALDLFNQLHGAYGRSGANSSISAHTALRPLLSPSCKEDRFNGDANDLVVGEPKLSAKGIWHFMRVDRQDMDEKLRHGPDCIVDEWKHALKNGHIEQADLEHLDYVLESPAGSSEKSFQNGWLRDCDPETKELIPERMRADGSGKKLEDFAADESAQKANLSLSHVLALRLYTTAAFKRINEPLRNLVSDTGDPKLKQPHPLPCTVYLISDGLKLLRAVNAPAAMRPGEINRDSSPILPRELERSDVNIESSVATFQLEASPNNSRALERRKPWNHSNSSTSPEFLWRGIKNVSTTKDYLLRGGSELAPCSTTANLEMAMFYAKDWQPEHAHVERALVLRVVVGDFMGRGADISFLSAFPHEEEALYPPLTFFKPVGKQERLTYNGTEFTVVDVRPTFPS